MIVPTKKPIIQNILLDFGNIIDEELQDHKMKVILEEEKMTMLNDVIIKLSTQICTLK